MMVMVVHKSVCQGVLVLMMGLSGSFSSRDEAQLSGRIGNILAFAWSTHLASGQNRPGISWGLTPFSFLTANIE